MISLTDGWGRFISLAVVMPFFVGSQAAHAGDLADVKARGKLIMLSYPVQGNPFIAVDLEVMRQRDLKLMELRKPDEFKGIDVELMNGFAKSLGVELEIHTNLGGWGALLPSLVIRNQGDGYYAWLAKAYLPNPAEFQNAVSSLAFGFSPAYGAFDIASVGVTAAVVVGVGVAWVALPAAGFYALARWRD